MLRQTIALCGFAALAAAYSIQPVDFLCGPGAGALGVGSATGQGLSERRERTFRSRPTDPWAPTGRARSGPVASVSIPAAQFPGLQLGNLNAPIRVSHPAVEVAWEAAV